VSLTTTTSSQHSAPSANDAQPTNKKRPRPIATKNTSSPSDIDSSGSGSGSGGSDGTDGDDERVNIDSKKNKHKRPPCKIARRHHNNNTNNNNIINDKPSDNNTTIKRRNTSVEKSFEEISSVFLKSGVHKRSASFFDSESETDVIRAGRDRTKRKKVIYISPVFVLCDSQFVICL
jgi:hypothetical protein